MVSRKDYEGLDFKSIEEYFDYIVASKINGNYSQTIELFNDLSKSQKKDFIEYIAGIYEPEDVLEILKYVNHY